MRNVFLDTVGLVALWDQRDQWHEAANVAYQALATQSAGLVTTDAILLECGNALARMSFRSAVVTLRRHLMQTNRLVILQPDDIESAWQSYAAGVGGGAGIVDLLSFQTMRRLGITEAFTNDKHFKTAGFVTLF